MLIKQMRFSEETQDHDVEYSQHHPILWNLTTAPVFFGWKANAVALAW